MPCNKYKGAQRRACYANTTKGGKSWNKKSTNKSKTTSRKRK